MKIVYLSTKISGSGGTAKITALKANNFIEKWGFEVAIISTNDESENPFYSFDSRVKFYFLKDKMTRLWAVVPLYLSIQRIIDEIKPDVIIVNDNGFKAYLAPLFLRGTPLWFEIHGSRKFLFKNDHNRLANKLISGITANLYKKFDAVILLNEQSKIEWQHPNLIVIPNFVESSTQVGMAMDSKEIIAIGRISAEKGHDRMLRIFERVSADYPDWSLHIYGKREDELLMTALLEQKIGQIYFHGESTDINARIAQSAFMIHTSYNEGMPMALLEVLNIGKTVIAFNVPFGVEDIISDGYNGFLIDDGDLDAFERRMRLLIQDRVVLAKLEYNAKSSLSQYRVESVLKQWESLFRTL